MALRHYSNAPATTLAASCTALDTTIQVASASGFPIAYPYTLILDWNTNTEEVVLVTGASGTTLTVTRGHDATTAFAHVLGAQVVHGVSAEDARDANTHVHATSGVHGLTGAPVGTTDNQTLTSKIIGASNTLNGFTPLRFMQSDANGRIVSGIKAIPIGDVVGLTDTQTLTNKTLGTSNIINGFTANRFMQSDAQGKLASSTKALPVGDVVGTTDSQTLTNKTMSGGTASGVSVSGSTLTGCTIGTSNAITFPDNSGNVSVTIASGWTLGAFVADIVGGRLVFARAQATRTGSTIVGGASGNITDELMLTVNVSTYRPNFSIYAAYNMNDTGFGVARLNSSGQIHLLTLTPGTNLNSGDTVYMTFAFLTGV